jgi:hypothetical protein
MELNMSTASFYIGKFYQNEREFNKAEPNSAKVEEINDFVKVSFLVPETGKPFVRQIPNEDVLRLKAALYNIDLMKLSFTQTNESEVSL